ncbi:SMC-Scp complex subunit ScpB [Mycoplasmopsis arginini]|uniref:SMC-Scp complex subunit ScpB n=2 Tax=Mycoplasmopsis TaxID=2767358 RepID=A0A0C6FY72_MYCAR|nr:SMC-Scp complex subunit ScpB [Mycoplasmopsis arginini]CRH55103.1 Segregation and condensation protein B [Chlamydia trachomatis]SGA02352.1 Segregation and condensation protein B [Chlamydia abortus]ENY69524.1 Segregation and condensation protein B [Mycoplasmopsis arginini 7264]MCY2902790.1 segregation/condensation protein B [Mycoplasmopsis arginini QMP CG1-2758]MDI3348090.1 segregation/condensation protein B [Mycoplasmopsis arginini]
MKNKIIEALLFIQGSDGLSSEQVKDVFKLNTIQEGRKLLKDFKTFFNNQDRGIKVHEFNDVYKFLTVESVKDYISELVTIVRKQRLSNAAIEVAGIVAYKQPVTRSIISNIRGVVSDGIVASLLEKGIIEEVGVAQTPGNPILYGITNKFYDYFKIKTLAELPPFPEFSRYSDVDEDMIDKDFNLFDSQRSDTNNDGIFLEESFDE